MISSQLSRASAVFLLVAGLALLFASDVILPRLISDFPAGGTWLGQLLGSSWLAVGALNWLSRAMLLGGIYGRPIVLANLSIYFIGAMVLLRTVATGETLTAVSFVFFPLVIFSAIYGWLLLRGPLLRDFELNRGT